MIAERLFHGRQKTSDLTDGQSETSALVPAEACQINLVMKTLRERVIFLIEHRNRSQADAARLGNFSNKAFISDIVIGKKLNVRGDNLKKLATGFSTTVDFLLGKTDNPEEPSSPTVVEKSSSDDVSGYVAAPELEPLDLGLFPRDVCMLGIAVAGDDADFTFNGDNGERVRRPPGIQGKRQVYALRVEGESMWPAFRHGALLYVDPTRRPGPGEDAIIELHPDADRPDEPGKGYFKRVVRVSGTRVTVEQYNPPREITFDRGDIKRFHRVIPWEELMAF